jgi:hypothetical protein
MAIDINLPIDASSLASANMTILNDNPSSVFVLPSEGIAGFETSIIYLYSDADLPLYSLFAGCSVLGGILEVGVQSLAHPLYNESHILMNYHKKWNVLTFGVNERYLSASVVNGSRSFSFLTDFGIGLEAPSFSTSIGIHNVFNAIYEDTILPKIYVAEIEYIPLSIASIGFGCEKQKGYDASLKIATRYQLSSAFRFLVGYQYQPDRFSGGLEFTGKHWQLCYALQTHSELDLTHAISLTWK